MKGTVYLDAPEKSNILASLVYSFLTFFSLSFLVSFFGAIIAEQFGDSLFVLSWLDIVYHCINFVFAIGCFKSYLQYSLEVLTFDRNMGLATAAAVGISLTYGIILMAVSLALMDRSVSFAAQGALPVTEMDILVLGSAVAADNPIFGTLTMVLLTPVTISCLFYCTSFAPAYNHNPWLGYLAVTVMSAFSSLCMILSGWPVLDEVLLFAVRLPIHLIACWSFQKTESIFVPMLVLAVNNLVACVVYIVMF